MSILRRRSIIGQNYDSIDPSILAWWKLDGDVLDYFGNRNGTLIGTGGFSTDRFGNANSAYEQDGTVGNRIETPKYNYSNQSFSYSFWYRPTNNSNAKYILAEKIQGSDPGIYFISVFGPINYSVQTNNAGGVSTNADTGITTPVLNTWNYCVFNVDRTTNTIGIYMSQYGSPFNSTPIGTATAPSMGIADINVQTKLVFGNSETSNGGIIGKLDDIKFRNKILTLQEMQDEFQAVK